MCQLIQYTTPPYAEGFSTSPVSFAVSCCLSYVCRWNCTFTSISLPSLLEQFSLAMFCAWCELFY